ncbi:MAG TPA: FIST N-terminal domain-containing protein [Burkholderiaceae bacterium]|jgi:small ligand-binding sensory domain FIST
MTARFLHGHATHPDARMALALAAAQVEAQRAEPGHAAAPTLGWLYLTDHYAPQAEALLADAQARWPGVAWVGATGVGIAAGGVEYFDEPALSLMLAELPHARFRVFSGARPLAGFDAHAAQVHVDPAAADLGELIRDMSERTASGYLFGGLASGRSRALHLADGVWSGGLSGVAFDAEVALVSRVTQGCQPVGPRRIVTASDRNVVTALDGEPALDCLLRDVGLAGIEARDALPKLRQILVGLGSADDQAPAAPLAPADRATRSAFDRTTRRDAFGADVRVRHLIGLDPGRRGIAIAELAEVGTPLAFCTRNVDAARRDLTRICAEVRDEVEPESLPLAAVHALRDAPPHEPGPTAGNGIAGAIYISCAGRGGAHFGAPSAELALVRHALGDVPLVGFFAGGEIARANLYGYTGVLTVFRTADE